VFSVCSQKTYLDFIIYLLHFFVQFIPIHCWHSNVKYKYVIVIWLKSTESSCRIVEYIYFKPSSSKAILNILRLSGSSSTNKILRILIIQLFYNSLFRCSSSICIFIAIIKLHILVICHQWKAKVKCCSSFLSIIDIIVIIFSPHFTTMRFYYIF
jgi:hypothetical protein